jgi:hypothetical protein
MPRVLRLETRPLIAASRPVSAVRPDASSLLARSSPRASGALVPATDAEFPQDEHYDLARNARSGEKFVAAEQAHPGSVPDDCSALPRVNDWTQYGSPAADYSVRRLAHASRPAIRAITRLGCGGTTGLRAVRL